jgi:hypothetical protein
MVIDGDRNAEKKKKALAKRNGMERKSARDYMS